ncbi:sugar transferase [Anaerosacchariphilus polymeriproducens]|uniref:Sugar transferase n=1 Tax=Anaerosacchariphilus polymeriproducens TaxID=1812858 RepID=A0A371AYZ6_9FIRM|nr:sugar transferase [Anaerosacchariphilus polymeriproducens]RDU24776.1 sugar transferase [Anaerosacchariphilus polymeriproducens]
MGKFSKGVTISLMRISGDVVMCLLSLFLTMIFMQMSMVEKEHIYIQCVFCVIYILASKSYQLYYVTTFYYIDRVIILVSKSFIIATGITSIAIFAVGKTNIENRYYVVSLAVNYFLLLAAALFLRKFMKALSGIVAPRTALIGNIEQFKKFHHFMNQSSASINEIGYISVTENPGEQYLGCINELEEIVHKHAIDQIYILQRSVKWKVMKNIIQECMEMGVTANVLLHCNHLEGVHMYTSSCGTYPVVTYHTVSLNKYESIIKRILDIVGSLVGIVLSSPIMLVTAIIIRSTSKGPAIFKQVRVGQNGRQFKIYKFRSMYLDAEEKKKELISKNKLESNHMFKLENDPRITKVGKFIRKTSIDELPQFFNVLKGDMSLVGTRPPTMDEIEYYERWHWKRMSIKPGITGLWQVNGRSQITDFQKIVEMDIEYITKWNVLLDIKILFKTIYVIFHHTDAF